MNLPTNERVFLTGLWAGLCSQHVCIVPDASNEEILEVCNAHEKSHGGTHEWSIVIRTPEDATKAAVNFVGPGPCKECPPRIHLVVR